MHIRHGIATQFIKKLVKDNKVAEEYLKRKLKISDAKLIGGVLNGPKIKKLMADADFVKLMSKVEANAWKSYKDHCQHFFSNSKTNQSTIPKLMTSFKKMGCLMNLKLHIVQSHSDLFPANPASFSDEMGERAHQDLKLVEQRFAGKDLLSAITDYCWSLTRETDGGCFRKSRSKMSHFKVREETP